MTVIRELYGLVNLPRGKSHRSGVLLFVSPPAYGNPGPLGHRNRPGDSDGKSGMQLGETLGSKKKPSSECGAKVNRQQQLVDGAVRRTASRKSRTALRGGGNTIFSGKHINYNTSAKRDEPRHRRRPARRPTPHNTMPEEEQHNRRRTRRPARRSRPYSDPTRLRRGSDDIRRS